MIRHDNLIPTPLFRRVVLSTIFVTVALAAVPASADDQLLLLAGNESLSGAGQAQATDIWQIEYVHALSQNFSFSIDHVNQGEFNQGVSRHPDYDGTGIWAQTDFFEHHLALSAGAGLLYYYDTVGSSYGHGSTNVHGLGTSYTVAATWYTDSPLLFQIRAGYVDEGGFDTRFVMLGLGYQLDGKRSAGADQSDAESAVFDENKNEVTLYGGQGLINQPYGTRTQSVALEYRRDLTDYLQWSVTYLDEGDSALADRRGVIGEIWLHKEFFDKRLSLAAGIGPYFARDRMQDPFVATMRSFSAAYRITPGVSVRTTWERVITNYNRDSDVFLLGGSYRF